MHSWLSILTVIACCVTAPAQITVGFGSEATGVFAPLFLAESPSLAANFVAVSADTPAFLRVDDMPIVPAPTGFFGDNFGFAMAAPLGGDSSLYLIRESSPTTWDISWASGDLFSTPYYVPGGSTMGGILDITSPLFSRPEFIVAPDLDGDTINDAVVAATTAAGMNILSYTFDTATFFSPVTVLSLAGTPAGLASADVDIDGMVEIVVATTTGTIHLIEVGPGGSLGSVTTMTAAELAGTTVTGMTVGDVRAGGNLEVVLARTGGAGTVVVIEEQGGPWVLSDVITGSPNTPIGAVGLDDVDGDSDLDIVLSTTEATGTSLSVYYQNVTDPGSPFSAAARQSLGQLASAAVSIVDTIVLGSDTILVSTMSGTIDEFRIGRSVFIRGDANNDGMVDITDVVFCLNSLSTPMSATPVNLDAADTNDDGAFDISDAVFLLDVLFSATPPAMPAPFPAAGFDPTEDTNTDSVNRDLNG